MTIEVMEKSIVLLGGILKEFQTTHRFILYVDALRVHVSPKVLRAASRVVLLTMRMFMSLSSNFDQHSRELDVIYMCP